MGHRINNRGTLVLDKVYKGGIGRIRRATGTNDQQTFDRYVFMLDQLQDTGRHDILLALKNKTLDFSEVFGKWRSQSLNTLNVVQDIVPLNKVLDWLDTADFGDSTTVKYKSCFRQLMKGNKNAVVSDLPEILKKYRDRCVKQDITRSFNQARAVCQSYISHQYGRHTPLWMSVSNIKVIKVGKRMMGNARTVKEVRETVKKMGSYGDMFWTLCVTGMGIKEYYGKWTIQGDRIHIEGTKRQDRDRIVPLIDKVIPPFACYDAFRLKLKSVQPNWVLYDGRRSFSHWCEMAGIPLTRIKLYMGHSQGPGGVTGLYLKHELDTYIKEDRKKLMDYIASQLKT